MQHRYLSRAVAVALLGLSSAASAITTVEQNASIPFSFSNPGARSLGMGGAFVALADDATAAYTNPAGLTGLGLEQQFGIELRRTETNAEYASGGSITPVPFSTEGVRYRDASAATNNVSFLSWVLPRERWALAFYRHELLNYRNGYTTDPIDAGGGLAINPFVARTDLSIISWGGSFAYNVTDNLTLGVGVTWNDFEIDTSSARYGAFTGSVNSAANLVSTQSQYGDDDDLGYSVGLIYRGSDNFNIGVSYRSAPKFDYRATNIAGPAYLAQQLAPGVFDGEVLSDQQVDFEAPDMLSVGFSWRPNDNLTVNLDVNRIGYSRLSEGIVSPFGNVPGNPLTIRTRIPLVLNGQTFPVGTPLQVVAAPEEQRIASLVTLDDVFETRLGMEYAFTQLANPVFLRLGAWHEPRHTLRFSVNPDTVFDEPANPNNPRVLAILNGAVFSTGQDEIHFTGGVGWAFKSFQMDFAFDHSDQQNVFSASGVWRF